MAWNEKELARIAKLHEENRRGREAEPGVQYVVEQPKSELRVEVLTTNLSGYKRGDRVVLSHMTPDQVQCLVESGAVRPDERPSKADLTKEASDG